jgi:hypothetical protein
MKRLAGSTGVDSITAKVSSRNSGAEGLTRRGMETLRCAEQLWAHGGLTPSLCLCYRGGQNMHCRQVLS